MDSNVITLEQGIKNLKEMFINFDEEIIVCVLMENTYEEAINQLLAMQGDFNKEKKNLEGEISIFKNVNTNPNNFDSNPKNSNKIDNTT
jgi:hypothetical protein